MKVVFFFEGGSLQFKRENWFVYVLFCSFNETAEHLPFISLQKEEKACQLVSQPYQFSCLVAFVECLSIIIGVTWCHN
jgi:hypothetical protein